MVTVALVSELNTILDLYKKDKNANPKAYLLCLIKGSDDFYQQSTYLKDIEGFEWISQSSSQNYIKIKYKDKQTSFKNTSQVFEFYVSLDPKEDEEKPNIKRNDSYTG